MARKSTKVLLLWWFLQIQCLAARIIEEHTVPLVFSQAVTGGLAELPCDTKPPEAGDKVYLVLWYKDGSGAPIYSFDARGKAFEQAQHWSDEQTLGGRAYFTFTKEPARLTIENVKENDGGVYRCRVDFKKSPTKNYRVNLTIIVPPQKLSVMDDRGSDINSAIIGPYNEGAALVLTCVAAGGRPRPRVTWWRENALIDDSFEASAGDSSMALVRNTLTITRLERRDLHTRLTCQATNNNISIPISMTLTLDMNFRPLEVAVLGDRVPLSADKEYEVYCQAVGARPPAVMTWWKGSNRLKNTHETTSSDGNTTTSTLIFTPVMEDSGKYLSCRAENPIIPSSAIEDGWKLDIHYVPIVTLDLGSTLNASNIREGVDVYFECSIKSNPWVYKVNWRHNGMMLVHNTSGGIIISNQSLVLQSVSRKSAGLYTCVASNREGDGESNPVYLDVKFAPVCKSNQQKVYGVARQEAARVTCEVDANPGDPLYKWKFNNTSETIDIQQSQYSTDRTRSTITYTPMTELDYGTLLCWAHNEVGSQKLPCVYHIIPAGRPDPLHNCTIHNQTAESLHVECGEGFDGGLPQSFVLEMYDGVTQQLVSNVTTNRSPSFTVTGLESGLEFHIHLYAANAKGRSDKTQLYAYTLKTAEKRTGKGDVSSPTMLPITPILGVMIGVVAALVLVAIIIVVIMRIRTSDDDDANDKESCGPNSNVMGVAVGVTAGGDAIDKACSVPLKKDCDDCDDKNPDIIPPQGCGQYTGHSAERNEDLSAKWSIAEVDYRDPDEKAFEKLNNAPLNALLYDKMATLRPTSNRMLENANNVRNRPKMGEEITYAELSLPQNNLYTQQLPGGGTMRRIHHPQHHPHPPEPIVYAQLADMAQQSMLTSVVPTNLDEMSCEAPLMSNSHRESTV